MDLIPYIFYVLAGAGVGFAVGMTGVGGGSLMTPLLILFGFPYNVAIGTDLLYAAVTKSGGVVSHSKHQTINWPLVGLLAAGSIPASLFTAYFLAEVFTGAEEYKPLLTTSLGVMLILTSIVLLFRKRLQESGKQAVEAGQQGFRRHSRPITVIAGIVLGVFVTLSSVGAGAFCAALLLVLYPRLPAIHVIGTDIAHAVPLTFIAGMGHFLLLGNVNFALLICLLIGSLPAIHWGTKLGNRLPNNVMHPILASILMLLGVKFALF